MEICNFTLPGAELEVQTYAPSELVGVWYTCLAQAVCR